MTDNFERYREFIRLLGGLPGSNAVSDLEYFYVIELIRRGKDNPDMPAANYHFKNYYIYSWQDLNRYEQEIKDICNLLKMRAYCSVNYKRMSQIALDTIAEGARRIAQHDYKRFNDIFASCSGKYNERSNSLWVVDLDNCQDAKVIRILENYINDMTSEYQVHGKPNVVFKMPTRSGYHLICHPFNLQEYYDSYKEYEQKVIGDIPDVQKNHVTLLYENL